MKFSLKIYEACINDVVEAYHWYEERKEGLGVELLLSFDASILAVQKAPQTYKSINKIHKVTFLSRFSLSFIFQS